jgi:hypothetical protein
MGCDTVHISMELPDFTASHSRWMQSQYSQPWGSQIISPQLVSIYSFAELVQPWSGVASSGALSGNQCCAPGSQIILLYHSVRRATHRLWNCGSHSTGEPPSSQAFFKTVYSCIYAEFWQVSTSGRFNIGVSEQAAAASETFRDSFFFVTAWQLKTKLRGFGPRANYTDRATAVCRRS